MRTRTQRRAATLMAAVAAALTIPANRAEAVYLSHDGVGQALIFPFYTVNGGNQTVISVVNTTNKVKAVRVNFHESRNGILIFNFNLYLAPFDAWVGAVYAPSPLSDAPATLISQDRSCTIPKVDTTARPRGFEFRNYSYTGSNRDYSYSLDLELDSLARTREGFIEMIEMGELRAGTGPMQLADEATPPGNAETPLDCDAFFRAWSRDALPRAWFGNGSQEIDLPTGGLYGNVHVIDVAEGTMLSLPVTALSEFYTDAAAPGKLHSELPIGELSLNAGGPSLRDASNGNGQVRARVTLRDGSTRTEIFPQERAIDAVSLTLMKTRIINEFQIDPLIGASTEWVLTYPTKLFHVSQRFRQYPENIFRDEFYDDGKSTVPLLATLHTRSGRSNRVPQGDCCDGLPCGVPPICDWTPGTNYAVNVLVFDGGTPPPVTTPNPGSDEKHVLDRLYTWANFDPGPTVVSGWASIANGDPNDRRSPTPYYLDGPTSGDAYLGLPVIGFAVTRVVNNSLAGGVLANYAAATPHRGELEVRPRSP